jgi:hypothetical protein
MMNLELDGENISIEQSSPSDTRRTLDQDDFYPADGQVIPMIAANASQNTGNYFDQDNFYPADGQLIPMVAAVAGQNTGNYFDQDNFYPANGLGSRLRSRRIANKQKRQQRRSTRQQSRFAKKQAKTNEIQSRADLNKSLGQDKQSDIELAKALATTSAPITSTKVDTGMTKNTKIVLGVVGGLVLIAGIYFLVKKKK